MITNLYNCFKHWSKTGSVYLISDPHINDSDCKLMNPNWPDPDEYLNTLNNIIHKHDTLICLGDCGDLSYIKKIKAGYKVLIKGNHDDKGNSKYIRQIIHESYRLFNYQKEDLCERLKTEYPDCNIHVKDNFIDQKWYVTIDNKLVDEVYSGPLFISDRILLAHEPINGLPFCLNIHGHVHNGINSYIDDLGGKHLNIASDVVDWSVISLNKLIKSGILSDITNIHRLTIDQAIENKNRKDSNYE